MIDVAIWLDTPAKFNKVVGLTVTLTNGGTRGATLSWSCGGDDVAFYFGTLDDLECFRDLITSAIATAVEDYRMTL